MRQQVAPVLLCLQLNNYHLLFYIFFGGIYMKKKNTVANYLQENIEDIINYRKAESNVQILQKYIIRHQAL